MSHVKQLGPGARLESKLLLGETSAGATERVRLIHVQPSPAASPKLGRYELLGRLAAGGMGEIFLARLEGAAGFERLCVVKKILPHLADDQRFRRMLIDEAHIAARMSHPNICQVYELAETDGQLYIVMEYLEGVTVLPLLRRASRAHTPLPLGLVTGIVSQTCEALHYAHELRERDGTPLHIVHRDVTPSNIFLTEAGVAKVLDFGIAKAKTASAQTQTGTVKGKYAYMAPEQLKGGTLDRRVDVFALGVVLFEMLSLRRLFQRKTDYLTFRAVMEQPIPDLRRYRPDVDDAMMSVVVRALSREPETRFASVRELGSALLDATAHTRAWATGELGDYLRQNFADAIRKRSASVLMMTRREVQGVGRATMPLLADMGGATDQESDADDEEFPSIESDFHQLDGAPAAVPRGYTPLEFAEHTPPPFSIDVRHGERGTLSSQFAAPQLGYHTGPHAQFAHAGSGATGQRPAFDQNRAQSDYAFAQAVRRTAGEMAAMQAAAQPPRRSVVLPIVAVGLLAVAVVALVLLWHQSRRDQSQVPVVYIEPRQTADSASGTLDAAAGQATSSDAASVRAPHDAALPAPLQAGSAGSAGSGSAQTGRPVRPKDPVLPVGGVERSKALAQKTLNSHLADFRGCVGNYDPSVNTAASELVIMVRADGRVTSAVVEPAKANNFSPFGACLRGVASGIRFSSLETDVTLRLPLKLK